MIISTTYVAIYTTLTGKLYDFLYIGVKYSLKKWNIAGALDDKPVSDIFP
jgi:hypothetical protein